MTHRAAKTRRLAEASGWLTLLAESGVETSMEFESWLAAEPENLDAWIAVSTPWNAIGDAASSPEALMARRDALYRANHHRRQREFGRMLRPVLAGGTIAAIVALVIYITFINVFSWDIYRTNLGERRTLTLADGSHLSLDSETEVRVRYSKNERRLELISGQARFDVAHEKNRPFSVVAGNETVIATGTAFNVNLVDAKVMVTLITGRITVISDPKTSKAGKIVDTPHRRSDTLVAGQQLIADPGGRRIIAPVHLEQVEAWQSGQLIFDNDTLEETAREVSRYTVRRIDVSPEIANLRISGVFNTGDGDTFVDAVTHYLDVEVEGRVDGSIVLRKGRR